MTLDPCLLGNQERVFGSLLSFNGKAVNNHHISQDFYIFPDDSQIQ